MRIASQQAFYKTRLRKLLPSELDSCENRNSAECLDLLRKDLLVYEDENNDTAYLGHRFFGLNVEIIFDAIRPPNSKPLAYSADISYSTVVYRLGNVGVADLLIVIAYFFVGFVTFRSELASIALFPFWLLKFFRGAQQVRTIEDASAAVLDVIDPLRLNGDVYKIGTYVLSWAFVVCRLL